MDDEYVGRWVRDRVHTGNTWNGMYRALGLKRDGRLIAGVVFTDYSGANISAHIAGEGNWCGRDFLAAAFAYPFRQLKVRRITAYVASQNFDSVRFVQKLGFEFESRMVAALPDDDFLVYRMFKGQCRWLKNG